MLVEAAPSHMLTTSCSSSPPVLGNRGEGAGRGAPAGTPARTKLRAEEGPAAARAPWFSSAAPRVELGAAERTKAPDLEWRGGGEVERTREGVEAQTPHSEPEPEVVGRCLQPGSRLLLLQTGLQCAACFSPPPPNLSATLLLGQPKRHPMERPTKPAALCPSSTWESGRKGSISCCPQEHRGKATTWKCPELPHPKAPPRPTVQPATPAPERHSGHSSSSRQRPRKRVGAPPPPQPACCKMAGETYHVG